MGFLSSLLLDMSALQWSFRGFIKSKDKGTRPGLVILGYVQYFSGFLLGRTANLMCVYVYFLFFLEMPPRRAGFLSGVLLHCSLRPLTVAARSLAGFHLGALAHSETLSTGSV